MTTTLQPAAARFAAAAVEHLRGHLPHLLAVYLFGSRVDGSQTQASDWDLAVWVDGKLEPTQSWRLGQDLADICGADVDLVDMRTASTVMQYQVIVHGVRVWQRGGDVELLEAMVLSEKTALDEARRPLMKRVFRRGKVYE